MAKKITALYDIVTIDPTTNRRQIHHFIDRDEAWAFAWSARVEGFNVEDFEHGYKIERDSTKAIQKLVMFTSSTKEERKAKQEVITLRLAV